MNDQLYICPCCERAGYTAAGLHRHQCRAKPARAKLTLIEISAAKPVPPGQPVYVMTKEEGGQG